MPYRKLRSGMVTLLKPAVGGILVASVGSPVTLLITAMLYAGYIASLLAIPAVCYRAPAMDDREDPLQAHESAWHFLRKSPILMVIGLVTLFFNLTYGPLEPALPVLVVHIYHAGAQMLGFLWSSFAVGLMIGTALWMRWQPGWGIRVVTIGGVTYAPYNIVATTWQQRLIPDQLRGRVFGLLQSVTSSGLPLGQMAGGLAIAAIGAGHTIASAGELRCY